jgi:hypothetical protein
MPDILAMEHISPENLFRKKNFISNIGGKNWHLPSLVW